MLNTIIHENRHPRQLLRSPKGEAEEIRDPMKIFLLDPGYSFTPFGIPG